MAQTESASEARALFVKGLPAKITADEVRDYLSRFGKVIHVDIPLGSDNRRIKRFAKVLMDNAHDVEAVLSCQTHLMNEHILSITRWVNQEYYLDSKDIMCRRMVFINHHSQLQRQKLAAYYSNYGKIISIESHPGNSHRKKRLFTFITYEFESSAIAACENPNVEVYGKRVICKPCRPCHRMMLLATPDTHHPISNMLNQRKMEDEVVQESNVARKKIHYKNQMDLPGQNYDFNNIYKGNNELSLTSPPYSLSNFDNNELIQKSNPHKYKGGLSSLKGLQSQYSSKDNSCTGIAISSSNTSNQVPHYVKPTSALFDSFPVEANHKALRNVLFRAKRLV